jgi:hypothetical protein
MHGTSSTGGNRLKRFAGDRRRRSLAAVSDGGISNNTSSGCCQAAWQTCNIQTVCDPDVGAPMWWAQQTPHVCTVTGIDCVAACSQRGCLFAVWQLIRSMFAAWQLIRSVATYSQRGLPAWPASLQLIRSSTCRGLTHPQGMHRALLAG